VEGLGDHGCEYMTGGRVVVLGPTGLNFAAGMSGGIAYVYDADGGFRGRCNTELVGFDAITPDESDELRGWICEHRDRTGSVVAARLLDDWQPTLNRIVKVMPHDYKRALAEQLAAEGEAEVAAAAAGPAATPGYAAGGSI
jgi:glutamate synthase domain-containing protein 3